MTTKTTSFDFDEVELWETSTTQILAVGTHIVTITQAEGGETENGNPRIRLEVANASGSLRDSLVYGEEFGIKKLASLWTYAMGDKPKPDEYDVVSGKPVMKDAAIAKLVGKQVGVVVHKEKSYKDPSKEYSGVKGYVSLDAAKNAGATASAPPAGGSSPVSDEDIPF